MADLIGKPIGLSPVGQLAAMLSTSQHDCKWIISVCGAKVPTGELTPEAKRCFGEMRSTATNNCRARGSVHLADSSSMSLLMSALRPSTSFSSGPIADMMRTRSIDSFASERVSTRLRWRPLRLTIGQEKEVRDPGTNALISIRTAQVVDLKTHIPTVSSALIALSVVLVLLSTVNCHMR